MNVSATKSYLAVHFHDQLASAARPAAPAQLPADPQESFLQTAGGTFGQTFAAPAPASGDGTFGASFAAAPHSAPAKPYQSPVSHFIPLFDPEPTPTPVATPTSAKKLSPMESLGYFSPKDTMHSGAMAALGYGGAPEAPKTGLAALGYNIAK